MSTAFEICLLKIFELEGVYSNDSDDPGGETAFGVTEKVAREMGYTGDMREYKKAHAAAAYSTIWEALDLDGLAAISLAVAFETFDTRINMGRWYAASFLQRSLNALNREEKDFIDIEVDGFLGVQTRLVLAQFLNQRGADGEKVLLRAVNALQGARYIEIAEKRKQSEAFLFGWLLHRVDLFFGRTP